MDDTHNSRASDAAAETRKRRSSILKSQRPPRTPFSELEFNVATPTDVTKSRRVSFSRRTGVAEFITNEATTTWRNFYEEQNKSLESSGNESGANAPRPIGHIGKRIFDQQFQDCEAVDFGSTLDSHPNRNINSSINNVNFTQQFASLEYTNDEKLSAPQQNFEMSAFTDNQSKLFGDDLAVPTLGEMSGRIDVNFSAVQNIGEIKDDLDVIQNDLDVIQNDLQRAQGNVGNVVCPGPFTSRRSLSEYIEVDLNATHVTIKNDEDDMSITDTIHSPKVQEISKSQSYTIDKKGNTSKDWVADKENITLNPYVAPKESTNFAVNDDNDKILVFDGKRLTIQSDKEAEKILKSSTDDLKPKEPKAPQRKTIIVLNTNDDLPNFVQNPHMSTSNGILSSASFRHGVMYDIDDELTNESYIIANQKPVKGNDFGNLSVTQPIPNNIIVSSDVPDDLVSAKIVASDNMEADISMTQALPAKIISSQESQVEPQRRRTILYENDGGDISMTQAISANILQNENQIPEAGRRKTILYDDVMSNISVTQAVPVNILLNANNQSNQPERRRTIVYDNDMGNISMTQAIPTKIILDENKDGSQPKSERRKTIIYDNDMGNISMTQSIPVNILVNKLRDTDRPEIERRRTIVYDNDMNNISITQAIPANIILNHNDENIAEPERRKTIIYDNDIGNISMTQVIPPHILVNENIDFNKSKTVIYDSNEADISMTQAISTNVLISNGINPDTVKRKTIVFESEDGDISITRALPSKIIIPEQLKPEKRQTILFDNDSLGNISITQAIPANIIQNDKSKLEGEKRSTMVYNNSAGNMSVTKTVPAKVILPAEDEYVEKNCLVASEIKSGNVSVNRDTSPNTNISTEKRKTIVYQDEAGNISVTQALPTNIFEKLANKELQDKINIVSSESDVDDISITRAVPTNILDEKRNTIVYEDGNISVTQTIPTNIFGTEKYDVSKINPDDKINIVSSDSDVGDITNTRHVTNVSLPNEKCKTIVYEDEAGNISVRTLPTDSLGADNKSEILNKTEILDKRKTTLYESTSPDISVTQAVLVNVLIVNNATEKRKPIMYDTEAMKPLAEYSNVNTEDGNQDGKTRNEPEQDVTEPRKESADITAEKDNDNVINMPLVPMQPQVLKTLDEPKNEDNRVTSSDSLIYIIRDTDDETQTEKTEEKTPKSLKWKDDLSKAQSSPLPLEYIEDVDAEVSANLQRKLYELKSLVPENNYEKLDGSGLKLNEPHDNSEVEDRWDISKGGRSFKDANDTNELLEMLSDLTDKRKTREPENPVEKIEPKRLSIAPSRLSIVLSREDLMNNISMAQAALQKSMEIDESVDETTSDTPIEELNTLPQKAARVSNEVVKKLNFEEDESASDASIKSDMKGTPLKKTAFGETSYMKESKAKVIPSYLKDVSDEIKALMSDLVKPNTDPVTFQVPPSEKSIRRDPSTCSTQIQANLITSSQIDLDTELNTVSDTGYDLDKESMPSGFSTDSSSRFSPRSKVKTPLREIEEASFRPKRESVKSPSQDRVIFFDQNNPLNNILLVPIDFSDVHKYNPHKSDDTTCGDNQSVHSSKDVDNIEARDFSDVHKYNPHKSDETTCGDSQSVHSSKDVDNIEASHMQIVGSVTVARSMQPSGDSHQDKSDAQSLLSATSKPGSVDESIYARVCELKDTKVNTLIAMKGNKELLEASSSLTLVDDALGQNTFDVDLSVTDASSVTNNQRKSPVQVIYDNKDQNLVEEPSEKLDTDYLTSSDDIMLPIKVSIKGKKRIYSPANRDNQKHASLSSFDVTPKPNKKMQKLSNSSERRSKDRSPEKLTAEKDEHGRSKSAMDVDDSSDGKQSPKEHKRKSPTSKKPGTSVTVQQLLAKYGIADIDQEMLNKQIIEALSRSDSSTAPNTVSLTDIPSKSPEIVSSFTSSKNQTEMREACSETTTDADSRTFSIRSRSREMEWQPDLTTDTSANTISKCESSVNVVAKIDMLPFMGSHECEWEASGADTWSFRLLHAQLRLSARLAHRHDNAARTRVRADTPVTHVAVDTALKDTKSPVATLCVGFAREAMRYFIGRGCSKAGDVPALLRRCAGVARVALRWGRAMHEAKLHLAYTLDNDGFLALKVANVPLRSVWEVTMRLELVVADAREVPWPRACDVRVLRVVSDVRVPDDEVQRALAHVPQDWGHAPRTVWKIFRYLKNKTRDDELLGV